MPKFLDLSGLKLVLNSITSKYDAFVDDVRSAIKSTEQVSNDAQDRSINAYDMATASKIASEQAIVDSQLAKSTSDQAIIDATEAKANSNQALTLSNEAKLASESASSISTMAKSVSEQSLITSNESKTLSLDASEKSNSAVTTSNEALRQSKIAVNSVSKLAGLTNATIASQTLAALVTQIEANASDIDLIQSQKVYLTKDEYKELEKSGGLLENVEYNIYK